MQKKSGIDKFKNLFLVPIFFAALSGYAKEPTSNDSSSLSSLIQFGLTNSLDQFAAQSESHYQQATEKSLRKAQLTPQIGLSASYQQFSYDRPYNNGSANPPSNNGQSPAYSLTVSYDLQKLFGPESKLARQSTEDAKLQEKMTSRDLIRNIKKSYFVIGEIQTEIAELNKLLELFARIDKVLQNQKRIGIYNEIERRQFQIQQSILSSDLQTRRLDLDSAYFQLSGLISSNITDTKERVSRITQKSEFHFAGLKDLDPEKLSAIQNQDIFKSFGREYNLSKLEYESFNALPLPSVYARGTRAVPTMLSSDGPQTIAEIGISIPLDSFLTRPTQKAQLSAKAAKAQALFEKTLFEYRNQIRLNAINLNRFKNQTESLKQTRLETEKLLDKAFLFYSQRRIDVLGTLDIFQKYLQAARNSLINELQIQTTDAELEYLVGGPTS